MAAPRVAFYVGALSLFTYLLYDYSSSFAPRCQHDYRCARFLTKSLLPGAPPTDVGDHQWRGFREKLTLLVPVAILHASCGARIRTHRTRVAYDAAAGLALILFIHRAQAAHLLVLALLNYCLVGLLCAALPKTAAEKATLVASWLFILSMLLLREYGRRPLKFGRLLGVSFAWLDRGHFGGMGWWDHANLLALRMHSHNIDQSAGQSRLRRGWWEYVAYLFYAPLYVAGPIMTSDDFSEQSRKEGGGSRKEGDDSVLVYAVRWICALFVMELLSARAPCFALASVGSRLLLGSSSSSAIDDPSAIGIGRLSASESLVFSYLRLQLVWLKFLIIWRFFTLWARLNGRSPPENLPAPSCSLFGFWNYSILGFWRSWHASFSRWLMIYLYVPLGGREHRYRNLLATFGFVALWHGVEGRMFGWAALVMLSIAPEVAASRFLDQHPGLRERWYHRHLVAACGATAICALMLANLVGFGSGTAEEALRTIALIGESGAEGLRAAVVAWALLFIGVHIMLDLEAWRAAKQEARVD